MKQFIKKLWTNERIFGGVVVGTVAALVTAQIVDPWASLVAIAAFTPFDELRN